MKQLMMSNGSTTEDVGEFIEDLIDLEFSIYKNSVPMIDGGSLTTFDGISVDNLGSAVRGLISKLHDKLSTYGMSVYIKEMNITDGVYLTLSISYNGEDYEIDTTI